MIHIKNATAYTKHKNRKVKVLENETFIFDINRIGIISDIEAISEHFMDLIAGYTRPLQGSITRFGKVSWPIGRMVQFRSPLNGKDTLSFLCDLYNIDFRKSQDFIMDIMDFDGYYLSRTEDWPGIILVKFAQTLALLPEFDIYLAEGSMVVGDETFMERWLPAFEQRLAGGRMLIQACSQQVYLERFVRHVAVVKEGKICLYDNCDDAFAQIGSMVESASTGQIYNAPLMDDDL